MKNVLKKYNLADFSAVSFQHLNIFDVRSKQRIPQNAASVIVIIFPYYNNCTCGGNISAYCAVSDYHIVVMEQLKSICADLAQQYPQHSFVPFVDSSPIDEVDAAVKAGLGVKGANSLLITPKYGSFVFIGEIVTDMETETVLCTDKGCLNCGLCTKACPGGALCSGFVDKEKCASFISQKKQELTEEQRQILKRAKTVFGCDICQKVCPHNKKVLAGDKEAAAGNTLFCDDVFATVTKENVEAVYKDRAFGFRGLKVLQRNLEIYGEAVGKTE
ncbi:MAG: epoxyqueuosine reductase [Oscillospiraceae bacterium]|nr:epoxyqueuosine reductase [Oscillospiraceae bacterium]